MHKLFSIRLAIILFFGLAPCYTVYADDFPLREEYPNVQPISTSDLYNEFGEVHIIDTRSSFEYEIIRIKGAKNILVSKTNFRRLLRDTVNDRDSKIVFYCNGRTCAKSYKAAVKAAESGYRNIVVYDAGVFEWTETYPDLSILLGKNPADLNDIISQGEFSDKLIDKKTFAKEATSPDAYLIDVRDAIQRKRTPDFARTAKRIPLDRLAEMLDDEKFKKEIAGKKLYLMDAVGKQVRWLQYHLKSKGLERYYFLKNGVWAFYSEDGAVDVGGISRSISEEKSEAQDDSGGQVRITGPLIEVLKRKIPEEKFNILRKEIEGKLLHPSKVFDIFEKYQIPGRTSDAVIEELYEYLSFKNNIHVIAPAALSINDLEGQIARKKHELKETQSEEVRAGIEEKIDELKARIQSYEDSIVELLRTVNEQYLPILPYVIEQLGYNSEQSEVISLHIRTQIDLLKTLDTMNSIIESIKKTGKDIEEMEKIRNRSRITDREQTLITEELQKVSKRLQELNRDFSVVVTGLEKGKLFRKEEKETDWNKELQEVFSPLIIQLKQVTERPRQMEILRSVIVYYENLLPKLAKAIDKIDKISEKIDTPETLKHLQELEEFWVQQEKEISSKLGAARHQLFELEKEKMSFTEVMEYLYGSVFKQRGINIFYAVIAFLVTFLICNLFRLLLIKINPLQHSPKYMFLGSLLDLLLYIFSFLAATTTMVVVLYIYGNWLVLATVIILLMGLVWATRNTLPIFIEEIKILLGFGEVRPNEKIIREGIAYRVKSIGIFSYFENPLLTGGLVRLPLRDLIGMRSRPYDENEPWFPTRKGDWIFLSDGSFGEVLMQTPDVVRIDTWWGSYKSYMPKDFLLQRPQNLSINCFSVNNILNLDFRHSDIVIEEIPQKVESMLQEKIAQQSYGKHLKCIIVEFKEFDSSSLNVIISGQFSGEAASAYFEIGWLFQQVALAACNKYGWQIALNQVMVHQTNPNISSSSGLT